MSLARVASLCIQPSGFAPARVTAQIQGGLPETRVLGHPQQAAFRDRLRAAIKGAGYKYPACRVTLDLESTTGCWDSEHLLPAALAILKATDQTRDPCIEQHRWLGQLTLDGKIEPSPAPWSAACGLYPNLLIGGQVTHLRRLEAIQARPIVPVSQPLTLPPGAPTELARWVLGGGLSAFVYGEPGVGKSRALCAIQSHWPNQARLRSHQLARWYRRRQALPAMRHTIPARATPAQLKHWFAVYQGSAVHMDDLPLHSPATRDSLNQLLDEHRDTALLASGNPCPCGWHGSQRKACRCDVGQRKRWQRCLPMPLLDRFAVLWRFDYTDQPPAAVDMTPIEQAQQIQTHRQGCLNGQLKVESLDQIPGLGPSMTRSLRLQAQALELSGRAQLCVAKVARTVADLEGRRAIRQDDLACALALRASPNEG